MFCSVIAVYYICKYYKFKSLPVLQLLTAEIKISLRSKVITSGFFLGILHFRSFCVATL